MMADPDLRGPDPEDIETCAVCGREIAEIEDVGLDMDGELMCEECIAGEAGVDG